MLPQKHRLPRELFGELLKKGRSFGAADFTVRTLAAPDGRSRFSFVAGGKVSKKAVARNRLRRRAYAAAARILPRLRSPLWIAVFFKPSAVSKTSHEMENELVKILPK